MSIVDKNFVYDKITNNQVYKKAPSGEIIIDYERVKYAWAHGATRYHLGDGLLVYSIIQFMRAKNCVCLGSGGGFIPRIMTQARLDLYDQEIFEGNSDFNWGDIGATFIVDAANGVGGNVDWLEEDSFFRNIFHPRVINDTTENAFYNFFVKEDIKIDYLHIDAGHSFEDVKRDFELYKNILSDYGVISIHDTDRSYEKSYIVSKDIKDQNHHDEFASGPADLVDLLKNDPNFEVFNFFNNGALKTKPSSTGFTLVKKSFPNVSL